jgi:Uma2 family endonuclease
MATSTTALMTIEEFRKLEDPPGFRLELHNGEVVRVTRPKYKHGIIQLQITLLLLKALKGQGRALPEFAFRARPEYELRVADVGWVSKARDTRVDRDDHLSGSPDIVVEVLSPSNSIREMVKKKALCFSTGCQEFWLVDPVECLVEVTPVNGSSRLYRSGDQIPVGSSVCAVDDIFSEEELD